ncbi:relaxase/mobilization nuclease domain-containing protein [Microbacterium sp. KSW4-11]|uniref:Relaxase/mobilization nuclease domain-containing protein n=1 Tax=Microbacterium gawkjiense TaxID=3067309 RepID=A0ABU3GE63_9MICO|nr:relaxase/mobilization nuclease domain-containing protein [Microbacterium sp. KSW4-11]MDT3318089.1 relaxase/mobilization nuclease domain-containing protein [Microbacterium sp. KSW4-11]
MIPNITRGSRIVGLMTYLAGEGRANEHTEQHLVAGDHAIMARHGYAVLDAAAAREIGVALDTPRVAYGVEVTRQVRVADPETGELHSERVAADVWHCSLSLRAEEGQLSDEQWGTIAQQFVDRMGFTESSGKAPCRWVAVRHGLSKNGNDHVHIAVSLVREDGTKATTHNDYKRAQELCRTLEVEHGLMPVDSRERGMGERGVKPAETARAARSGAAEVDAHRLERTVRAAATASVDEGEFVRRMRRAGVLIRPRFAAGRDDVVAGYSVALRPVGDERPVWFGGGRLARDLTLPRLREGWPDSPQTAQGAVDEWRATSKNPWQYRPVAPGREEHAPDPKLWEQYGRELRELRAQLREVPATDRATWAHVARETAGAFAAWSQRVEATPGPLAETARELSRSAHIRAHQSKPKPVRMGSASGAAMVLMQAAVGGEGPAAEAILFRQLGRLSVALIDAHKAAGDARRAEQMSESLRRTLEAIGERMPADARAAAAPAATATLSPEEEAVRRAQRGLAAPGTRSPLPNTLTPRPRSTSDTSRQRDGHNGREGDQDHGR